MSKERWRFCKISWPSQNIQTLVKSNILVLVGITLKILPLYHSKDGGNQKKNHFGASWQTFGRNRLNLFGLIKINQTSVKRRYENVVYFNSHLRWKPLTRILHTFCACEWWIPWGFFCKSRDRCPTIWRRMRSRLWPWPLWVCRKWGPVHRNLLPRQ